MPLTPDEVHEHSLNQRVKAFQEVCGFIDESLRNSYDGDRPIAVHVKVAENYRKDPILLKMVTTAFDAAGWEVYDSGDQGWHFEEKSPPDEPTFQLPASRGPYR
jgi:hypothetical protein